VRALSEVEEAPGMAIVVGYLPTPEGRAALRAAAEECTLRSTSLLVVHSRREGRGRGGDEAQEERELAQVARELEAAGVQHEVRRLTHSSDPADDLITVAEETGAEAIVIGLRRRTPVGKLILGSNAQRILLEAPCPVLAVKAEES
jgi:nucleotide-binding universal stress UspA family protein